MSGKLSLMDPIVADKAKFEQVLKDQACDVVDAMLAEGYVPDPKCIKVVCTNGNLTLLHTLLKYDMDVQAGFLVAVICGRMELLNHLYVAGADVNLPNENGSTALHLVSEPEICTWLLDMGAQQTTNQRGNTPLLNACYNEYCDIVKILLASEQGIQSISCPGEEGVFPLHWATYKSDLFDILLEHEQGVQTILQKDDQGRTPLFWLCEDGNYPLTRRLLSYEQGVQSILIPDNSGQTPLFAACLKGNIDTVKLLLSYEQGVQSILIPDNDGQTPMDNAEISPKIRALLQEKLNY